MLASEEAGRGCGDSQRAQGLEPASSELMTFPYSWCLIAPYRLVLRLVSRFLVASEDHQRNVFGGNQKDKSPCERIRLEKRALHIRGNISTRSFQPRNFKNFRPIQAGRLGFSGEVGTRLTSSPLLPQEGPNEAAEAAQRS